MLTYNLSEKSGSLYKNLCDFIREDICSGKLKAGEKMPSKRTLAENLGISTITVQNSYDQLISEGYMYALPKKGYFISDISNLQKFSENSQRKLNIKLPDAKINYDFDFSSNTTEAQNFPFSTWARLLRKTISEKENSLLEVSPCGGVYELRKAIAGHLNSFRGMSVDPDQIVTGAGTEYLYGLLIKLLGKDKIYCIENPGYKKLKEIYKSNDVECCSANLDSSGLSVEELKKSGAQIAHISPNHHFPTGITMPVKRRYEILEWANESTDRFIIEDDYDSEFRVNGKPLPTLQSIDANGKVIYMNTFSKSLASTIRISYMVLPEKLANIFYEKLAFYSCTVSTFEQYTLATFISQGFFEKHINRMRLHYLRKRNRVLEILKKTFASKKSSENPVSILENDSGLHFLLKISTKMSDKEVQQKLLEKRIKISSISDFNIEEKKEDSHLFILNYSNLPVEGLESALKTLSEIIKC